MSRRSLFVTGVLSTTLAVAATHALAMRSAQVDEKEVLFAFFADLEGGEWHGAGDWSAGGRFEQVHRYQRVLDGHIVRSLTLIPDSAGSGLMERAEGVRAWDEEAGLMRFWEFDRYGGISSGRVGIQDGALYYEYTYAVSGSTRTLRDEWRPRGGGTYDYRVGVWEDGAWGQIFLDGAFTRPARL